MKTARLGDLEVSAIGLGAMTMAGTYRALDLGVTHIDTAEIYTAADNIELTADQLRRLNMLRASAGERHDETNMASIDR